MPNRVAISLDNNKLFLIPNKLFNPSIAIKAAKIYEKKPIITNEDIQQVLTNV